MNGLFIDQFGNKEYYLNGVLHREDGPAREMANGDKSYWINGKCHRDGDLPSIICSNGEKYYSINGLLHREGNMPAIDYPNGDKSYWNHGKLHRTDGPAFESNNQNQEFWINGIEFCEECYWKEIKK